MSKNELIIQKLQRDNSELIGLVHQQMLIIEALSKELMKAKGLT